VLQLPARPTSAAEADAQKRVTYVGWSGTEVQDRGPLYPIMKESDIMGALVEAEERTKVA
jgi:co-chaperonin GroES (HSP10)